MGSEFYNAGGKTIVEAHSDMSILQAMAAHAKTVRNRAAEARRKLVATTFRQGLILPMLSSLIDDISVADLITRMEKLWETSKPLNHCRYLPDIHIQTPAQRAEAGLPPTCMVWPNQGDQLAFVSKIPGPHSPLAYVAGDEFGAVFNCHREDFDLHSINFLHVGRKTWIVIPPAYCSILEAQFRATQGY